MQYRASDLEASGGEKSSDLDTLHAFPRFEGCYQVGHRAQCYAGHFALNLAQGFRFNLLRLMQQPEINGGNTCWGVA